MSHHEMRITYIDTLLCEKVESPRVGESRWQVLVDETPVDIVLVENGEARLLCSAVVPASPPDAELLQEAQRDLPFGRLDVRDNEVVVSHSLHADGITEPSLDNAIRFVAWAADTLTEQIDPQPRLDGLGSMFQRDDAGDEESDPPKGAVPEGVVGTAGYL